MAKTLIISVFTMIALSTVQVSMAQQLITHENFPSWVRKEAPSQCQRQVGLVRDLMDENPYSTEGKCYLIQTAPYEHDRQNLDRSTALFFFSEWTNGRDSRPIWLNYGDKPLPSDCTAWFVGIGVLEYKDVSGALRKIPKVKVVKIRAENELRRRVEKEMWGDSALVGRRTKKEAPPECGQQVSSLHHLVGDNPFETEGKCYFIYSPWLADRQLLDRSRALYTTHSAYGGARALIDFDKIDAPAEASASWNAYVMGMGAFQYESASGKMMTVPKVKVIKILKGKR
jgi:hypothetical protein